jgi:hypothetical protein
VALTADGVLDLDLRAVRIGGAVTLQGAPLPATETSRGSLRFVRRDATPSPATGATLTVPLGRRGAFAYDIVLPAATYRIDYVPDGPLCRDNPAAVLPCVEGPIPDRAEVRLGADGVLDIDIPRVLVSGNVTLDAAPLPTVAGERGALRFALADGGSVTARAFGRAGAVLYDVSLLPGDYTVVFEGNADLCAATPLPPVPCNSGPLREVRLAADGVLDIDIPAVHVSGAVTLEGARLPDQTGERGRLSFSLHRGGLIHTPSFGRAGAVTYDLVLLSGNYDIAWVPVAGACLAATPGPLPCNPGPVKSARLTADGVLGIDLHAVRVSGAVTLAGRRLPDAAADRGRILFALRDGGPVRVIALDTRGAIAYDVRVLPGTYDISLDANTSACAADVPPAVPCVPGPLRSVALTADGVLDIDIPAVSVAGAITLNGGRLPTDAHTRGRIAFIQDGGGQVRHDLGTRGPDSYALTLLPGNYAIHFVRGEVLCDDPAAAGMPCSSGLLRTAALTADGVLDIDLPMVRIEGLVTLMGAPLPSASRERGRIVFTHTDAGDAWLPAIPQRGGYAYSVPLLPGRYVAWHQSHDDLCAAGASLALPCVHQPLAGCN